MTTKIRSKKNTAISDAMTFIGDQLTTMQQQGVNGVFTVRFGLKDGGVCSTSTAIEQNYIKTTPVPKVRRAS